MPGELTGHRVARPRLGEGACQTLVHRLALTRQERRVGRLGDQRVTEAVRARGRVGGDVRRCSSGFPTVDMLRDVPAASKADQVLARAFVAVVSCTVLGIGRHVLLAPPDAGRSGL
jgi:hypothetical protein